MQIIQFWLLEKAIRHDDLNVCIKIKVCAHLKKSKKIQKNYKNNNTILHFKSSISTFQPKEKLLYWLMAVSSQVSSNIILLN